MSNNSIVEHRANYYYVEFREEFLIICMDCTYKKPSKNGKKSAASPHCKALILAILENWVNNKRGKREDTAIFMTYKQWSDSMYGMFGRTAIIDSLDELLGEGLISREPYKMPGNKDTYKYRLNYQELNRRIRQLPERDIHDTHPKTDGYPSKNERDASKNERVTHPKTDAYPSKNGRNIESDIESKNIDTTERKKEPTAKSSEESFSHSSTPELSFKNVSFSSETKQEEVMLSEEEQRVYDLGAQTIFKVKPPKVTATVKEHCASIAKAGITTLEKIESLIAFTKQEKHLVGKTLYLGNLVNALNGWLLSQQQPPQREHHTHKGSPTAIPPMSKEERDAITKRNLAKLKASIAEREAKEKVAQ